MRGAEGLGGLVGIAGVLITVIATSRLVGYRDLDNRPAGYLAVLATVVLTVALSTVQGTATLVVGTGVWIALSGITAALIGALLD